MIGRATLARWPIWIGLGLAALAVSPFTGGTLGAIGMGIGLGATTFSLLALAWVIGIVARPASAPATPWWRTLFIVFCFLLKVPILGAGILFVQAQGGAAPGHFLFGLFLVYSALVGWFLARSGPA